MSATKSNRGRKTAFKQEYIQLAENYSLLGATDKEMADLFGISEKTFNTWKKKFPEFLQSLKKGKALADATVASKLYNRALGYDFNEIYYEKVIVDSKDEDCLPETLFEAKIIKKHMPPDTTAQIFWLKNRQPDKWRDRKELDAAVRLEDELESMTDEQLLSIVNDKKEP
ncbi:transcriptional regulator with XRE-family HTH domain [Dysgonomonas hofstadii]|uniref:Transcriptional regulator with XRE-family HTH domain n=1 Tax=Dysgonomonas hofstadii TaxID=637886 RepID=A0A840CPF9_9BACT|nr:helix-turn-helix domain-containing protein [Dysgonomonas hofstadii]MBB4036569.1 transcriptional regulator with XRE-family HTH domain [Dysgonomonas hofstadii]